MLKYTPKVKTINSSNKLKNANVDDDSADDTFNEDESMIGSERGDEMRAMQDILI